MKKPNSFQQKKRRLPFPLLLSLLLLLLLSVLFLLYTSDFYRAEDSAWTAFAADTVSVREISAGWIFDGPSDSAALIFYPGAKVEEAAYAPMLHLLAERGMDVFLVKMPFHLAFFGINSAAGLMADYSYDRWYIGGHSLGGAMAASYAADHGAQLEGVILFAAYPTKKLDDSLTEVLLYGSEDGVLNMEKLAEGRSYAPANFVDHVIVGGNHAQFGTYGKQKGDGTASIPALDQQREAVEVVLAAVQRTD